MNKILISHIVLIVFLSSCNKEKERIDYNTHFTSFEEIEKHFVDPPAAFRAAPFWVWNYRMSKEKIDRHLEDYKEKGFGGVFIHPRYGLITEYLSEEWHELVAYSVEKGKELGLFVWLYDENSFPSGFGGGHVPAEMPEAVSEGQGLLATYREKFQFEDTRKLMFVFHKQEDGTWQNITSLQDEFMGKEGDFLMFHRVDYRDSGRNPKWYGGFSYVDLIKPGVTEKFIELTMEGYEEHIGGQFGRQVPGIFTDEPNIRPPLNKSLRYTPDLFDYFSERWGYELQDNLPYLLEETGEWKKVRHNYYTVLLELFIERWSKPWWEYTESKGLLWTGHYWEHGWPNPEHGGDNMAMYAWHQVPGIDMLFNTWTGRPDQFGNTRAGKELQSVANQLNRPRTLSETYGGAGWEISFKDLKRNGDWEYSQGVNLMNQHLSYESILGDRKHDFPQSFSRHDPWWEVYSYQNDYFARLSLVLSSGSMHHDVLVIEPTTTAWMYYVPGRENTRMDELGERFEAFLEELERYHVEYDLGCENIFREHGSVRDGRFTVGGRSYRTVALPPGVESLDEHTVNLLGQFLEEGGKLLSFAGVPDRVDGESSSKPAGLIEQYGSLCTSEKDLPDQQEIELMLPTTIRVVTGEEPEYRFYHHRRQLEDGELLFLVNSSGDQTMEGSFFTGATSILELDAMEGTIRQYPFTGNKQQKEVHYTIPPSGSLLLYLANEKTAREYPVKEMPDYRIFRPEGELEITRKEDNILVLDYCELYMGGKDMGRHFFYKAGQKIWQEHGFGENPWVSSVQYKTRIVDRDTFSTGSGYRLDFSFRLAEDFQAEKLHAVVERPGLFTVRINGAVIESEPDRWYLDPSFGVYDIRDQVKPGANTISYGIRPMSIYAEIAPVFITGSFRLVPDKEGWIVVPDDELSTGSWKEQGYPFYSDKVAYRKDLVLDREADYLKVKLEEWKGTVARVLLNGEEAGIIQSPPYSLEIPGPFKSGQDMVLTVEVYGSLKNILGPHHNVQRRGIVTPWSFKYAPEQQPAGLDYDVLDYGLMQDFSIFAGKKGS